MYEFWQASLFGGAPIEVDAEFRARERVVLDEHSWIDHEQGWLSGADNLFTQLASALPWRQREVVMFERKLAEPRLTWWWEATSFDPEPLPILGEVRRVLSGHYHVALDSIGANWYRDGRDSVAWHGDRERHLPQPLVAIVSVGTPRPFLVRRRGGGSSSRFVLGHGDLLVMGGRCQHDWEHCVPKVARTGPRISVTFRHHT